VFEQVLLAIAIGPQRFQPPLLLVLILPVIVAMVKDGQEVDH
jgi:hypothetical protein